MYHANEQIAIALHVHEPIALNSARLILFKKLNGMNVDLFLRKKQLPKSAKKVKNMFKCDFFKIMNYFRIFIFKRGRKIITRAGDGKLNIEL